MSYKSLAKRRQEQEAQKKQMSFVRNTFFAAAFLGAGGYWGGAYVEKAAEGTFMEPAVEAVFGVFEGKNTGITAESQRAYIVYDEISYGIDDFIIRAEGERNSITFEQAMAMAARNIAEISLEGNSGSVSYRNTDYVNFSGDSGDMDYDRMSIRSTHSSVEQYGDILEGYFYIGSFPQTQLLLMTPYVSEDGKSVTFLKRQLSPKKEDALKWLVRYLNATDTLSAEDQLRLEHYMVVYSAYMSVENLQELLEDDSLSSQKSIDIVKSELEKRKTTPLLPATVTEENNLSWNPYTGYLPKIFN